MGSSLLDIAAGISNPDLTDKGLQKTAQAAPTFAELAAAQQSNPLNPFINPPTRPTGPTLDPAFAGGNIDSKVLDPSRQGATNAYGTRVSEAQGMPAKPTPFLGGSGSGKVGSALSPERERLASDDQSRKDQTELLNAKALIDERNKSLMTAGEGAAQAAIGKRETQRAADDAALTQMRTEMQKHADDRTRALEAQAAETRAAKVDPQHWFKERGTVGSLLAAISIGAGAFAAAMPHTNSKENFAMKIIGDSINQDINAQENDIANKWKALNYQGDQNEKEYVKGQYMVNAKRDAMISGYDHATALVHEMRNTTDNQVAISNLDKLQVELTNKKIDLTKEGAAQREAVAIKERAATAAAAAANPLSAANLNKAYAKYATDAAAEQVKNPKAGPILSREDWFKVQQGQGRGAGAGGEGSQEASFEKGVAGIEAKAKKASETGAGDWLLSHLPSIVAPGSNVAMDNLDQYNEGMLPAATRLLGDRVPPEAIKEQTSHFRISPTMSREQKAERVQAFKDFLRTNRAVGVGAKKGTTDAGDEAVAGATPVGE